MKHKDELTLVVHSCDSYSDLWFPFFALFKKYWPDNSYRILLNTESKDFSFEGMNIECVHPKSQDAPYGQRLMEAVSHVKTKYVLPVLDDFFLRRPVDVAQIEKIIEWMEQDNSIVYFNCDCTPLYYDGYEDGKYKGYHRLPPGNDYILNMQAAIWRTDKYLSYWRKNVSPWEWEMYCNTLAFKNSNDAFFCRYNQEPLFYYGHYCVGDIWGVFRGKWVIEDVGPLFEKEGIKVDFSKRGIYDPNSVKSPFSPVRSRWDKCSQIYRCLGLWHLCGAIYIRLRYRGSIDYYDYLKQRAKNNFLSQRNI